MYIFIMMNDTSLLKDNKFMNRLVRDVRTLFGENLKTEVAEWLIAYAY